MVADPLHGGHRVWQDVAHHRQRPLGDSLVGALGGQEGTTVRTRADQTVSVGSVVMLTCSPSTVSSSSVSELVEVRTCPHTKIIKKLCLNLETSYICHCLPSCSDFLFTLVFSSILSVHSSAHMSQQGCFVSQLNTDLRLLHSQCVQ